MIASDFFYQINQIEILTLDLYKRHCYYNPKLFVTNKKRRIEKQQNSKIQYADIGIRSGKFFK